MAIARADVEAEPHERNVEMAEKSAAEKSYEYSRGKDAALGGDTNFFGFHSKEYNDGFSAGERIRKEQSK